MAIGVGSRVYHHADRADDPRPLGTVTELVTGPLDLHSADVAWDTGEQGRHPVANLVETT